jgi:hypothetical protein
MRCRRERHGAGKCQGRNMEVRTDRARKLKWEKCKAVCEICQKRSVMWCCVSLLCIRASQPRTYLCFLRTVC